VRLNDQTWIIQVKRGLSTDLPGSGEFAVAEPAYTTDEKQVYIADSLGAPHPVGGPRIVLPATAADITASIPAGYCIDDVFIQETANNAVTGGLRIGTTNGGNEVVASIAVGALSFTRTLPGGLTTSGPFSPTAAQTIYIQAVTAWNGAIVDIVIPLKRAIV
jgi:hypothetical protein